MASFSGLCLVFAIVFALAESTFMHPHFAKKMHFAKKGFGIGAGSNFRVRGGIGQGISSGNYPYFRQIHVPQKVVQTIPVVKTVPVFRKVFIDRPVYTPVVRTAQDRHNPEAWFPKSRPYPEPVPIALQGPASRVDRQPGPNANIDISTNFPDMGNFGGGMDIGMDIGGGGGIDLGLNFGGGGGIEFNNFDFNGLNMDMGNMLPDFGNIDIGINAMDLNNMGGAAMGSGGRGFIDPVSAQPVGETIVTSNIMITDADTVHSNSHSASSQSQSSSFNLNANIHDADTVHIGGPGGITSHHGSGSSESNLLNGLDGLSGLMDIAMLGGGAAAALDMGLTGTQQGMGQGLGPLDHGHGHGGGFTDLLGGFGPGPVDHLATAAVHDGQAGMMVGEPVAIVSLDGHLGGSGHGGHSTGHRGHDIGMTSGSHAGHI